MFVRAYQTRLCMVECFSFFKKKNSILVSHSFVLIKSCKLTVLRDFLSAHFSASSPTVCARTSGLLQTLRALGTSLILAGCITII